jgi:hypothetical protein
MSRTPRDSGSRPGTRAERSPGGGAHRAPRGARGGHARTGPLERETDPGHPRSTGSHRGTHRAQGAGLHAAAGRAAGTVSHTASTVSHAAAAVSRTAQGLSGRTLVYAGAGLALAGVGAVTVAAGFGGTGVAGADSLGRAVLSHPGLRPGQADGQGNRAARRRAARTGSRARRGTQPGQQHEQTWSAISQVIAGQTQPKTGHGPLPAFDQLTPVGTSGPQSWMAMTAARYQNATTIVRQALDMHMGLRAAVIAVATAMQESTLLNIDYGSYDSVGLFQQRPSAGWGTPQQIMNPDYSARAFLSALRAYQGSNPGWAQQPLWEPAQGVQDSAFPYAYAQWEAEAAHVVATIARQLV